MDSLKYFAATGKDNIYKKIIFLLYTIEKTENMVMNNVSLKFNLLYFVKMNINNTVTIMSGKFTSITGCHSSIDVRSYMKVLIVYKKISYVYGLINNDKTYIVINEKNLFIDTSL